MPAAAATPPVDIAAIPPGLPASRVPPNLLIDLSLTHAAVAAAYPGADDYDRGKEYLGYFNAAMCYRYPMKHRAGSAVKEPDLADATAYFSIAGPADALHECGGTSFSGNFMNWASSSVLDILRYGLTGGDRVIDEAGRTVLQRAWLPDGKVNPDFYAHPRYFPRKVLAAAGTGTGSGIGTGSAPSRVTPFDTPLLYIVSCRNRILFSDSADGGNCDTPRFLPKASVPARSDKYFGEYLVRVSVCDAIEGLARMDLCVPYRKGKSYKPAGSIQQHAATLRIGLFSYLTGHGAGDPNLYGGALRAPLAYIGQKKFDGPDFIAAPNGTPEWSADSGVLSAAPGGVIRYVNTLGRGSPEQPGRYKNADPLSELYYESLRYLQGRQPSAGSPVLSDDAGFPVMTHWSDPVTAACQRHLIVTIANTHTVEDRYVPGNSRSDYLDAARAGDSFGPAPLDVMEWTRRIGDMEADMSGKYGNHAARPGLSGLERQNTGEAGRGTYYAAGLAYWAHANAIRPDKTFRVDNAVIDLDRGGNGVPGAANPRGIKPRDSQLYLMAKYGAFDDRNLDGNPFRTTASVAGPPLDNNAEWSGAGLDPGSYFLGSEPVALIAAIRSVFAGAAMGAASGRKPARTLIAAPKAGEDTYLFQTEFDSANHSGSLLRLAASLDAAGLHVGKRLWDAGAMLDGDAGSVPPLAGKPAAHERRIYTLDKSATPATVPFEWERLSADQRALLDVPPALDEPKARTPDGWGRQRLAYLRGERGLEAGQPGGILRRRDGILGAAADGAPLYVGAPSAAIGGAEYTAFHASYQLRRKMVYLGMGDGMLHGFDAASGVEVLAYLPNALLADINELASTHYAGRPYADGSAGVGEALVAGRWRTILVSGMGAGGQGVFALDVTDPDHFEADGALWEFTDLDDAAIGNLMAPPAIAKFRIGSRDGIPQYRYFAVVSSGLNNYVDDGKGRFVHGAAGALFLLALDKPAAAKWQAGVNYYKLAIPLSDSGSANGIGPPALVAGMDGAVRYGYVGDLQGNLWRIDFSGNPPWSESVGPGAGKKPLFVARDTSGKRQPISQQPKVVYVPGGGYLVLFGTGQWIEADDAVPSTFSTQSFYAIHDLLKDKVVVSGRAELSERILSGAADDPSVGIVGEVAAHTGPAASKGWYLDFAQGNLSGERSVVDATLASGKVFFTTVLPGRDPCLAATARSYSLDSLSGFAVNDSGIAQSGGVSGHLFASEIRSAPLVWEMAASVGVRGATGRAAVRKELLVIHPDLAIAAGKDVPGSLVRGASLSLPAKRLSWREVANWRELHDAAKK
ncbi:type IV pilus assembly protein, tip-associated adhesin PilY1 [Janthinobacterium agaricidamnosum NBRC 102515 = DSM 9628]|uniref:Type IV pilus assembly protein, tip-associated adhesin PilY1 n=2 Tax=Janthinobacterium agaricidamnosum TaxID=55508 RepID=W0VAZ0_9BURK|nr:type IV pilus assembly protein, tip-associated adhesin PilY1 [Janthinobacterium agaricidamnosum NBRC 102515 = DSM 9628]